MPANDNVTEAEQKLFSDLVTLCGESDVDNQTIIAITGQMVGRMLRHMSECPVAMLQLFYANVQIGNEAESARIQGEVN